KGVAGEVRERCVGPPEGLQVRIRRHATNTILTAGVQLNESFRTLDRQRPQKDRVDERENRRIDADSKSQCNNSGDGEDGASAKGTPGESNVVQEIAH